MSSATSIDRANERVSAGTAERADVRRDTFKPWHFFVFASLLAATAAVIMARQARPEHLILVSLTIGAAGFAGAALVRTLLPLVRPEETAESAPLTDSVRAALEREKMLVLRSIKELEFDRAMGKISPKDFEEMAGRLRGRAMSLMRQLDAGYQELIERELNVRLRQPGARRSGGATAPAAMPAVEARSCACGTLNDADAAFCKRCGAKLGAVS